MADHINRQRALNFLAAYYAGDADAATRCCSDDVLFMVYLPVELFPHLGPQRGRQAIADVMAVLDARHSKRRHQVKFAVADEQGAAVIVDVTFTKRADERVVQLTTGNFFALERGLITEIRSFFDTIDWVSQLTGRDLVGPLLREVGPELRTPNPAPAATE